MSQKYPDRVEELPYKEFYAIVTDSSCSGGYDERIDYLAWQTYESREEWAGEAQRLTLQGKKFKAIKCTPATILTTVTVKE